MEKEQEGLERKKVLVIGATGFSGRFITRSMVESGLSLRILTRDKENAKKLFPSGVEIVKGDLLSFSDLENAINGTKGIYLNIPLQKVEKSTLTRTSCADGLKNLLVLSKMAGVEHVITSFMLGARPNSPVLKDWWGFESQNRAHEIIKSSGIPYSTFFCSPFMENFKTRFRKGKKIRIFGDSQNPIFWSSASQLGEIASRAFFNPSFMNQDFMVQGETGLNLKKAAELFVEMSKDSSLALLESESNLVRLFSQFRTQMEFESQWVKAVVKEKEVYQSAVTWEKFGIRPKDFLEYASQQN